MNDRSSADTQPEPHAAAALSQDAGLVRWATRLKYAGYLFLALGITPIFLAEPYRRIGGLILGLGVILWWLCLTARHGCLAWAWPAGSPQRRRGLAITGALAVPPALIVAGIVWMALS